MGDIIPLTNAHLGINEANEEIVLLLRALLAKAEMGDVIGMGAYWIEGQNDIVFEVSEGHARGALMVAAAVGLSDETLRRWQKSNQ